ncbi:HEPN domain-containing protein [Thermosulfurimonas marina]|uniref:HEPN domain-containing protein n=1 Tax=Thermosulfurimonas marina TaxID=2047767 RepID=A0A6H1WSU4_9BACT|nr:HEPN domain-containing protein [Thermosulfurimonas marina]QJA06248.1 HEPN domain-containing protein [Thermosulfurimonas marina]
MTNLALARSYLFKAQKRLKILPVLLEEEDFSDVVREAQEVVELALKAMLRYVGVDPPKWHDVGRVLLENADLFPEDIRLELPELARISKRLRKERELAFYGDIDFIPTEEYGPEEAREAMAEAEKVVRVARELIGGD